MLLEPDFGQYFCLVGFQKRLPQRSDCDALLHWWNESKLCWSQGTGFSQCTIFGLQRSSWGESRAILASYVFTEQPSFLDSLRYVLLSLPSHSLSNIETMDWLVTQHHNRHNYFRRPHSGKPPGVAQGDQLLVRDREQAKGSATRSGNPEADQRGWGQERGREFGWGSVLEKVKQS